MLRPPPIQTIDLFAPDRATLLNLLAGLTDEEWQRPTVCAGWSVKDVALHLLGGDLTNLSRRRDGFRGPAAVAGETVVSLVNRLNDEWLRAARRLSTSVVQELLAAMETPLFEYFAGLDPLALGPRVSWAGPEPAPVWLDIAREYTERWHHQQHIREAVHQPGQESRRFLQPVLATFAHALPMTYQNVAAPVGTTIQLHVTGESGGDWTVQRDANRWQLYLGAPDEPTARVTLDPSTAWKRFTKGLELAAAREKARCEGDLVLASRLLETIAIIG